jgi:hypothetical protein
LDDTSFLLGKKMNIKEKIFLSIIGFIVLLVITFTVSKMLLCSPDTSVGKVALPLAKVIFEHIEKNGVPENFSDIEEIPYEFKDCNKTQYKGDRSDYTAIEDREECYFKSADKTYHVKMVNAYRNPSTYHHNIDIHITQHKTEYRYSMRYNKKKEQWDYEYFPDAIIHFDWDCWICNPKLFRITD